MYVLVTVSLLFLFFSNVFALSLTYFFLFSNIQRGRGDTTPISTLYMESSMLFYDIPRSVTWDI